MIKDDGECKGLVGLGDGYVLLLLKVRIDLRRFVISDLHVWRNNQWRAS